MNALTTSALSTSRIMQAKGNAALSSRSMVGVKTQPKVQGGVKEFFAVLLRSFGTAAA